MQFGNLVSKSSKNGTSTHSFVVGLFVYCGKGMGIMVSGAMMNLKDDLACPLSSFL